jgi:hypothetical protein
MEWQVSPEGATQVVKKQCKPVPPFQGWTEPSVEPAFPGLPAELMKDRGKIVATYKWDSGYG